jgi:DNA-binding transcriptional MerR regulator
LIFTDFAKILKLKSGPDQQDRLAVQRDGMTMRDQLFEAPSMIGIAEAKRRFGLTERAIRFYEERGLIEVERDFRNQRLFDRKAQTRLKWISNLRHADLPLRDIQHVLETEEKAGQGAELAREKLCAHRERLMDQLRTVDAIAIGLTPAAPAAVDRIAC